MEGSLVNCQCRCVNWAVIGSDNHLLPVQRQTIICTNDGLLSTNFCATWMYVRADSRSAASQWETALLCNDVSHWLDANLESALYVYSPYLACRQIRAFSSQRSLTFSNSCSSAMARSHAGWGARPTPASMSLRMASRVTDGVSLRVCRTLSSHRACCSTCKEVIKDWLQHRIWDQWELKSYGFSWSCHNGAWLENLRVLWLD